MTELNVVIQVEVLYSILVTDSAEQLSPIFTIRKESFSKRICGTVQVPVGLQAVSDIDLVRWVHKCLLLINRIGEDLNNKQSKEERRRSADDLLITILAAEYLHREVARRKKLSHAKGH